MDIPSQRRCFPTCKIPEKRDFMDVNPEKSEKDFYTNYDPMVGIGTAAILITFFIVITIKSFIRWLIRKYNLFKYKRAAMKLSKIQNNAIQNYENNHIDNNNVVEVTIGGRGGMALNGKVINA